MSQTRTDRRAAPAPRPRARRCGSPGWRDRLNQHPMAPYYLILGASMLLLVLGLVMVLSSSAVESYDIHGSAFTLFSRQAIFAGLGVLAMVVHLADADLADPPVRACCFLVFSHRAAAARRSCPGIGGGRPRPAQLDPPGRTVPAAALGVRQARADRVVGRTSFVQARPAPAPVARPAPAVHPGRGR